MEIKTIRRNIGKSNNYRVIYGDCRQFDLLKVEVNYQGKLYLYEVEAKYLKTETDSIHFKYTVENGSLRLTWTNWIAPYIHPQETGFWNCFKKVIKRMLSYFRG